MWPVAQRSKGDIESALSRKGFARVENDHSWFVYFTTDQKKSRLKTKTSHGSRSTSIGDSLLGMMARQCALTKSEFLELVDCTMSRDAFQAVAKDRAKL